MTHMVTRCPKCATSFRITSAQLQSAKGAVRCGSCLHIFKAQDHLIGGAPKAATPPPAAPKREVNVKQTPTVKATSNTPSSPNKTAKTDLEPASVKVPAAPKTAQAKPPVSATSKSGEQTLIFDQEQINRELAEDDYLISDDMDEDPKKKGTESTYEFDGFLDLDHIPKQSVSLFDREIRKEQPQKDEPDTDESWAENLLDEASDESRSPLSEPESVSSKKEPHKKSSRKGTQKERSTELHTEDHKGEHKPNKPHTPYIPIETEEIEAAPPPSSTGFKGHIFSLIGEKPGPDDDQDDSSYSQKKAPYMSAFDSARSALLMNIKPEPVVMTARRKQGWYKKRMWAGLSVALILLLFIQVAWLQFDNLNRTEPYRSFYAQVCPSVGCTLKPLVDRKKIRAYNLVVRNHPKIKEALMVDAILLNNAPFDQPFPDLVLSFSTMAEVPVASRRFTPAEYLRGELAGITLMPKNQPVHLTLELVDPGPDAVNYHAYIPE